LAAAHTKGGGNRISSGYYRGREVTAEFEAAGDALTGTLISRAVEAEHGEGRRTVRGVCLNCGTTLYGKHCLECGQAGHVHRTLSAYGHDLLHGVFHFEGKIWRTVPMLVWKPGELTRRYIHGERAKFVSPLALFLFTVFLTFAVVNSVAGGFHAPKVSAANAKKSFGQLDAELKSETARLTALRQKIAGLAGSDPQRDIVEAQIDKTEENVEALDLARNALTGDEWTFIGDSTNVTYFWGPLNLAFREASRNPDLLIYKLQSSAYKYSWALIPLSTPFVWLMFFWRREYKVYDHAVFVTYSLTFMLMLVTALTLAGSAGAAEPVIPLLAVFVPPLFTYRQLRGAYQIGRFGAIVRTVALLLFGTVVLSVFVVLLVTLGVLG
jgi:hypothetical protein